jgi:hypothetical protein
MNSYLRQSTASQVRSIGPFVDDTDFKTLENALTIANTDIRIKKNGAASAAKNSGGATADGNGGLYAVTWNATDTDTVGELSVSVKVAGALVYFCTYFVLEEAVYDSMYAAAAPGYVVDQPVNTTKWAGTTVTTGDIAIKTTLAKTTHITGFNDISTANVQTELGTYGALKPTVAARTLDVSTGGEAGLDWANIGAPTTTVNLSGTTIGVLTTNNDKTGYSLTSDFRIKKNTALPNFTFLMVDAVGNPATALTITAQRSLDGAALTTMANAAAEISNGLYKINLATSDTNADFVAYRFSASGAKDRIIAFPTQTE